MGNEVGDPLHNNEKSFLFLLSCRVILPKEKDTILFHFFHSFYEVLLFKEMYIVLYVQKIQNYNRIELAYCFSWHIDCSVPFGLTFVSMITVLCNNKTIVSTPDYRYIWYLSHQDEAHYSIRALCKRVPHASFIWN